MKVLLNTQPARHVGMRHFLFSFIMLVMAGLCVGVVQV